MKPFLLLATRDDDVAADDEYASVCEFTGLAPEQLIRVRVESAPLGEIDLNTYSGVLLGGSQFSASEESKSAEQLRVEDDLARLIQRIVAEDFPFFGMCYGVGLITTLLGGVVDSTYSETTRAIWIELTEAGRADPILDGVPDRFQSFVGHKEACTVPPESATVLATGEDCPVQMYRVKDNTYVTQFHPELDADHLIFRMKLYRNSGYFQPHEFDALVADIRAAEVDESAHLLLRNFVSRYARE